MVVVGGEASRRISSRKRGVRGSTRAARQAQATDPSTGVAKYDIPEERLLEMMAAVDYDPIANTETIKLRNGNGDVAKDRLRLASKYNLPPFNWPASPPTREPIEIVGTQTLEPTPRPTFGLIPAVTPAPTQKPTFGLVPAPTQPAPTPKPTFGLVPAPTTPAPTPVQVPPPTPPPTPSTPAPVPPLTPPPTPSTPAPVPPLTPPPTPSAPAPVPPLTPPPTPSTPAPVPPPTPPPTPSTPVPSPAPPSDPSLTPPTDTPVPQTTNPPASTSPPTPGPTKAPVPEPTDTPLPGPTNTIEPGSTNPPVGATGTEPTALPTSVVSLTPSDVPSELPSDVPSGFDSFSVIPSALPSVYPTSPSMSSQPTKLMFETTTLADGQQLSECDPLMEEGTAESPGYSVEEVLPFTYHLYVTESTREETAQVIVETLERRLHQAMALRFLTCQQQQRRRLKEDEWVGVNSSPADAVQGPCPSDVATVEGANCYAVNAGVTPMYVPTSTKEELRNRVGAFLVDQMDNGGLDASNVHPNLVGMSFANFETEEQVAPDQPDNGPEVSGVQRDSDGGSDQTPPMVFGGIAIAIAVCAALLVIGMLIRQRRNDRGPGEHFVKQIDEDDDDSSFVETASSGKYSPGRPEAPIILTGSMDEEDDESRFSVPKVDGIEHLDHDSDACKSKTCEICQAKLLSQPTFVSADMELDIQRDLGPRRPGSGENASRNYCAPNTVDL